MRNLKRILSLAMASIMLVGMMVVGAAAVDFPDSDKITHVDAVNSLVALGVIKGKDDGNFDAEGIVTRAEMAKMICVSLNGGKDPQLGNASTDSYTDTVGHWASAYIEYCTNLGIVAGKGEGKFDPNATVTGVEAAKMMLVAMNYDSTVFGFTGPKWDISVGTQANSAGLYEKLPDLNPSEGLTRDAAAQLIWNGIQAKTMTKTWNQSQDSGEITQGYTLTGATLLASKFHAATFVGTFVGNKDTGATNTKGEVVVYGKLTDDESSTLKRNASFPADVNIADIGEEFTVLYKEGNGGSANRPDKKDTIYGVYNNENTTTYEITKADMQDSESDTKVKFGGVKYDIADNGVEVVTNYITGSSTTYTHVAGAGNLQAVLKSQSVDSIKFVTDTDGKIAYAYVTEYTAGRVTGLTATKITISGVGSIVIDDNDVYDGVKKDDVVVYTKFYNTDKDDAYFTITKAEEVEGEFTGYKKDSSPATYKNVVVDGETYKVESPAAALANLSDDAITSPADGNIGDTVRVYLMNGMAVAIQAIDQAGGKYAMITECSPTGILGSNMNPIKVTVLLPDGTKQTLNVHKDSVKNGTTTKIALGDVPAGTLVEYSSINDGQIKIKSVAGLVGNSGALNAVTAKDASGLNYVWNKTTKALNYATTTTAVASADAVLYILVDSNGNGIADAGEDFYAYTMRGVGNVDNTNTSGVKVAYYLKDGQAAAAYMTLAAKPGSSTADTLYGIVTGYTGTRSLDGDTYYQYSVSVGREDDLTVYVDDSATLAAGDLVKFDEATDGKYTGNDGTKNNAGDFTHLVTATGTAATKTVIAAVKDYNESTRLLTYFSDTSRASVKDAFTGTDASITVDKDVKIVYVNAKDNKAGEDIGVGAFDASTGYANAVLHVNSDDVVDAIIVETSGNANLDVYGSNKKIASTNFGATAGVTLSGVSDIAASAGTNAAYTVTVDKAAPSVGDTFVISVALAGGIDGNNAKETVSVTYNSETQTLDFTAAGTKTVSFEAVSGQSVVSVSVTPTTK